MNTSNTDEPKYRLMVENARDLVFELDAAGNFLYMSPAWTDYFGININDYLGKSFTPLVHPDDIPICMKLLQDVVRTGERGESGEYRVRLADGTWRWHQATGSPVLEDDGSIRCYVGVSRDITPLIMARTELQNTLIDREKLFREYRHRVKNSFQIITSMLDYRAIQHPGMSAPEALKEIKTRVVALERLYTLLYTTETTEMVNLAEYCRMVTETLLDLSPGIERNMVLEPVTVPVSFAGTVGLILVELLTNAIKYAFPDSGRGHVNIHLVRRDTGLNLVVEDDGEGIRDEKENNGMGTALVRGMACKLRGTISISAQKGTKISMDFPLPVPT